MGVYQSATRPDVRVRNFSFLVTQGEIDRLGEKYLFSRLRKQYKIPAKVKPLIEPDTVDGNALVCKFSWYEVETFN